MPKQLANQCFAHRHMTPQEFGVYEYVGAVTHKSGVFFMDAESLAREFEGRGWRVFHDIVNGLAAKGWLRLIRAKTRTKNGTFAPAQYARVEHPEWFKAHPDECRATAPKCSGPLQPESEPLQPGATTTAPKCKKVCKEETSKEKSVIESEPDANNAPPLAFSKPKASGKDRKSLGREAALVEEIKKVALDASDCKAVFWGKDSKAIRQILIENPSLDRNDVLNAVRNRVSDKDEFRLTHCGAEIAEILLALIQYKAEAPEERARIEAAKAASIAAGREADAVEREALLKRIAEDEEASARMEALFGQVSTVAQSQV